MQMIIKDQPFVLDLKNGRCMYDGRQYLYLWVDPRQVRKYSVTPGQKVAVDGLFCTVLTRPVEDVRKVLWDRGFVRRHEFTTPEALRKRTTDPDQAIFDAKHAAWRPAARIYKSDRCWLAYNQGDGGRIGKPFGFWIAPDCTSEDVLAVLNRVS